MGIVVYNPQALKSHFLPFIGQDGPKLEIYDNFTTYMTLFYYIFMSPMVKLTFKLFT